MIAFLRFLTFLINNMMTLFALWQTSLVLLFITSRQNKGYKIQRIQNKQTLNVGLSASNSCYVSDGVRKGCHWSLLVLDLEAHHAYYGESLA